MRGTTWKGPEIRQNTSGNEVDMVPTNVHWLDRGDHWFEKFEVKKKNIKNQQVTEAIAGPASRTQQKTCLKNTFAKEVLI